MPRNVQPAQKVTKAQAKAVAAGAGLAKAQAFVAGTKVPVKQGKPVVPIQPGTAKVVTTGLPQTAAANPSITLTNKWSQVPVRIEGSVKDKTYLDIRNLARYIPITRIQEKNGVRYPDPLGNDLVISTTIFSFNYLGETLVRSGARLSSPTTGATSVSGV
jgi:hypothetical protein